MTSAQSTYQASTGNGVSKTRMVVLLYETVIGDLGRAVAGMRSHDVQGRTIEVQHALDVIGILQGTLDMNRGGEPARQLDAFYNQMRLKMIQACAVQSETVLQSVISDFIVLRDAWQQIDREVTKSASVPSSSGVAAEWTA